MKFEQGKTYNTVKMLGVVMKDGGFLQLSQRTGQNGGADVMPTENMKFEGRENAKLIFSREDGTRVVGHQSHFDPSHAYNASGKKMHKSDSGAKLLAAKASLVRAEAEAAKAAKKLAVVEEELSDLKDPAIVAEAADSLIDEVTRSEAEELFAIE